MAAGLARCPWDRRLPPTGPPSAGPGQKLTSLYLQGAASRRGMEMFGDEGPFLASLSFIVLSQARPHFCISRRLPLRPRPWAL